MEWGRQMAFDQPYYFYLWDPDWGPAFWKTNAYAPSRCGCTSTGMSGPSASCDRAGIGYQALDNGFRWCADPAPCSASVTGSVRGR